MAAAHEEEDVNNLAFGEFGGVDFLSNASAAILLQAVASRKYQDRQPPEVFSKAVSYAKKFAGAVEISDVAGVDQLFTELSSLQFDREEEETKQVMVPSLDGSGPEVRTVTETVKRSYKFDKYEVRHGSTVSPGGPLLSFDSAALFASSGALSLFSLPVLGRRLCYFLLVGVLQITALANLHPPSLEAARALIPSLSRYTDTELETVMQILGRASTRMSLQMIGLAASSGTVGAPLETNGAGAGARGEGSSDMMMMLS